MEVNYLTVAISTFINQTNDETLFIGMIAHVYIDSSFYQQLQKTEGQNKHI